MRSIGWSDDKVDHILCIIARILHLGQVKFGGTMVVKGQEIAVIADDRMVVEVAKLLGVDLDKLITALTTCIIAARRELIRTNLNLHYGDVLEAIHIPRMGYPNHLDHAGFFKRYRMLLLLTIYDSMKFLLSMVDVVLALLDMLWKEEMAPTAVGRCCQYYMRMLLSQACRIGRCAQGCRASNDGQGDQ
jgi:myosin heavy subunit